VLGESSSGARDVSTEHARVQGNRKVGDSRRSLTCCFSHSRFFLTQLGTLCDDSLKSKETRRIMNCKKEEKTT